MRRLAVLIVIFFSTSVGLAAQSYVLKNSVFSSSGGVLSSQSYSLRQVLGQTVIGTGRSQSYTEFAGFAYSVVASTFIGIAESESERPLAFKMFPNFPNPFRTATVLRFSVPRKTDVVLKIFDITGRRVREWRLDGLEPGLHTVTWDGRDALGRDVHSGIYFWVMETKDFRKVLKVEKVR